jgi:uncharacterized protein (TIGR02679 family)
MNALPDWVTDPTLHPLWDAVRNRYERNGLQARGRLRVLLETREQRHAAGDLLGQPVTGQRLTIDLGVLDQRLRERAAAGGLGEVLTRLYGQAPQDRPAARAALQASREAPLRLAADLVDAPWAHDWIAGLRQTGLLTNRDDAQATVREAARVLLHLTDPDMPTVTRSRVELGATVVGDAHALDRDRVLHHVVLRGLAAAAGTAVPTSTPERERLWGRFGVEPDLLSRTCLVWGLRIEAEGSLGRRLDAAADAGDPVHLTAWDLRRVSTVRPRPATPVLVCENPRVLEAVAESGLTGWAAVCTSGEPNLVVDRVLRDIASAGAPLFYHGDFDWPGVAIANRIIDNVGAVAWKMTAFDYLQAVRADGPPLAGRPVEPSWDAELGAAMRTQSRAVHEESVLAGLIESMR